MSKEPTEAELDRLISRQMQRLPAWWWDEDPDAPDELPGLRREDAREHRRKVVVELASAGIGDAEIARRLKLSRGVVYDIRKRLGVPAGGTPRTL